MFGKRFEYKDPDLQTMVERDHKSIHLTGSVSILVQWSDLMITREFHIALHIKDLTCGLKGGIYIVAVKSYNNYMVCIVRCYRCTTSSLGWDLVLKTGGI